MARFIVFEGLDGSGKTTQQSLYSQWLTGRGVPHIGTREPSGTRLGQLTREAISRGLGLENETIALLFAADRHQHVNDEILPALARGEHVLCDRYYFSNFAYQGRETPLERLIAYNARAMELAPPDLTCFIDVPPEECVRRINAARDGAGLYENLETLRVVRERYLAVFEKFAGTHKTAIIDTRGCAPKETAERVRKTISEYFDL